ncbi:MULTISPECIES: hypothetical protein [unclassified Moraxella]
MANYAVLCVGGGVEINPSDKLISVPLVGAGGGKSCSSSPHF